MIAKYFRAMLVGLFALGYIQLSSADLTERNKEWQTNTYPTIGLKMQIPHWKVDFDDQKRRWFLFAYPLVENPNDDAQYRVVISVLKLPEKEHLRIYPKGGTNASDWINSQHLQTSQMTNAFWIYVRKDVFGSNGFAYYCSGRIKRIPNPEPDAIQKFGGEEGMLAEDVQRILDSVEVLPTNSLSRLP
jgi:hypothetical protein